MFSYEEDCVILHSGMTFRELADYMFVPISYIRERHEDLQSGKYSEFKPPKVPRGPIVKWTDAERARARGLRNRGISCLRIGQMMGRSKSSIRHILGEAHRARAK